MEKRLLGERLRSAREKLNWTQSAAAKKIGIHNSTLGKYELGEREPDIETVKKIAGIYDVPPQWLLVGYEIDLKTEDNAEERTDLQSTIRLIEEEAEKLGLSPTDPAFKEMLSDAFDLLRLARGKNLK
ncbi:helix-turn-helix domain-containing protein [Paenibacillus tarimensis]